MPTLTFYLTNEVLATEIWELRRPEVGLNPSTDTTTKATVGKSAVCTYFKFRPGVTVTASGDFPSISLAKSGWRTGSPLRGTFDAGTWTFSVKLRNETKYGFSVKVAVRLSKSSNADGSNATLIIVSESPNVKQLPASAGSVVTDSWTWSAPSLTFSDEYLFAEYRIHIEAAASNNTAQCSFVCDENTGEEAISTPNFTALCAITLSSKHYYGTNNNLGTIVFDGVEYTLPTTIYKVQGTYTVKYNPASGYAFKYWTQEYGNLYFEDIGANPTNVTVNGDDILYAIYLTLCTLSLQSRQNDNSTYNKGKIKVSGTEYTLPTDIQLVQGSYTVEYILESGYYFSSWETSGDITVQYPTRMITTITIGGDAILRAVYAKAGWLQGWNYRKFHTIPPVFGAGTGYQVRFKVHYGSGTDSGEDVYLNGHCRSDFGDVRFTSKDGVTLYNYYIEEKVDGDYAIIWVKIDDDLSYDPAAVYLYYGKSDATTTSNGPGTFLFFDHFDSDTETLTFVGGGTWVREPQNSWIKWISPSTTQDAFAYKTMSSRDYVIHARMMRSHGFMFMGLVGRYGDTDNWFGTTLRYTYHAYPFSIEKKIGGTFSYLTWTEATIADSGVWYKMQFKFCGSVLTSTFDTRTISVDSQMYPTLYHIGLHMYNYQATANQYVYVDYIFVRRYEVGDLTHGAWGSEESAPPAAPTETIVAQEYPMLYLPKPLKASMLLSKVEGATITSVANDFPEVLIKKGKAQELKSKFTASS